MYSFNSPLLGLLQKWWRVVLLGGRGKSRVLLPCPVHGPKGTSEALICSPRWCWAQQRKTWSSQVCLWTRECNPPYLNPLWLHGFIITPLVSFFLWDKATHPSSWVSGSFAVILLIYCCSWVLPLLTSRNQEAAAEQRLLSTTLFTAISIWKVHAEAFYLMLFSSLFCNIKCFAFLLYKSVCAIKVLRS